MGFQVFGAPREQTYEDLRVCKLLGKPTEQTYTQLAFVLLALFFKEAHPRMKNVILMLGSTSWYEKCHIDAWYQKL